MNVVRMLPEADPRVETGATAFGKDWPGTFIRGDDAFYYAINLETAVSLLKDTDDPFLLIALQNLLADLQSSRLKPPEQP